MTPEENVCPYNTKFELYSVTTGRKYYIIYICVSILYSKTRVKRPVSKRPKLVFKTNYRLMQVYSIAECSKGSILPSLTRPPISASFSKKSRT